MFYTSIKRRGKKILHRFIDDKGRRNMIEEVFEPTLYVPHEKQTGWKSLYGQNVIPKRFDDMREAADYIKEYGSISGFQIFGTSNWPHAFAIEKYPGVIQPDLDMIQTVFVDIEVYSGNGFPKPELATEEVQIVSCYSTLYKKMTVFSTTKFEPQELPYEVEVRHYKTERDLLTGFISFWKRDYPDIISGWNSDGFDVPYLVNRIIRMFGEETVSQLSPWGVVSTREVLTKFGKQTKAEILGVESLDYMDLYKKYEPGEKESFKLGDICELELDETKWETEYPTLHEFFSKDPENYCRYNVQDVNLLVKLDNAKKLIALHCDLAYKAKINFQDAFGPVKLWGSMIVSDLYSLQQVIPLSEHNGSDSEFVGAFVKEPRVGLTRWCTTLDATSMYPKAIISYNISPETMINDVSELKSEVLKKAFRKKWLDELTSWTLPPDLIEALVKENITMAANGQMYRRDVQGFLPKRVSEMFDGRKKEKKLKLDKKKQIKEIESILKERGIEF